MKYQEMPGFVCVGTHSDPKVNGGVHLPLYAFKEPEDGPSINTAEGWNAMGRIQNARSFSHAFGREPVTDVEVSAWVNAIAREG